MLFYLIGAAGFVCYVIYDVFTVKKPGNPFCRFGFWLGTVCTAMATLLMFQSVSFQNSSLLITGGLISAVFLALEIYTLFFALPFHDTYTDESRMRSVCSKGVYALCRHPGVLWFAGLYLGLCIIIFTTESILQAVFITALDFAYVVFQDKWTFPRTFSDYGEYKNSVPFLLPNVRSIRACRKDIFTERK